MSTTVSTIEGKVIGIHRAVYHEGNFVLMANQANFYFVKLKTEFYLDLIEVGDNIALTNCLVPMNNTLHYNAVEKTNVRIN